MDKPCYAWPDSRYAATTVPEVKGYHDIIAGGVKKTGYPSVLTVLLAGDPNMNEEHETKLHVVHNNTCAHIHSASAQLYAQLWVSPKRVACSRL